jgi:hypothetical protein
VPDTSPVTATDWPTRWRASGLVGTTTSRAPSETTAYAAPSAPRTGSPSGPGIPPESFGGTTGPSGRPPPLQPSVVLALEGRRGAWGPPGRSRGTGAARGGERGAPGARRRDRRERRTARPRGPARPGRGGGSAARGACPAGGRLRGARAGASRRGGATRDGGCGGEGDKVAPAELFCRAVAERDVVAGAVGGLDDGVVLSRQLVGEALGCHAAVEGWRGILREEVVERAVPRGIAVESGVHLLDDVAARSQVAQVRRPVRRQAPGGGPRPAPRGGAARGAACGP